MIRFDQFHEVISNVCYRFYLAYSYFDLKLQIHKRLKLGIESSLISGDMILYIFKISNTQMFKSMKIESSQT